MSHFYLLLEFAKVFNWTDRIVEVRVVAGWPTTGDAPLLDKKIRGQLQDECLRFKLPLKLQVAKPAQTLKIQVSTGAGRSLGSADLVLDANSTKQKIHYLPLVGSQNKILQVNVGVDFEARAKTPNKDIVLECERVVHETLQRKIITNIELKRNDEFIRNREKFLTEYSRSKSRSQTKDFPSKINNLLQEVRDIKNAIRQSSSRSNSRVLARDSAVTPSRLNSLQSIEERPKSRMFNRSPKEQIPVRSPKRVYNDGRTRFPTQAPEAYNEYGMRNKPGVFEQRAVKMPQPADRNSRVPTPTQERNSRVPTPQEDRHSRQSDRVKPEERFSEKFKDRSKDRPQVQPQGYPRRPY